MPTAFKQIILTDHSENHVINLLKNCLSKPSLFSQNKNKCKVLLEVTKGLILAKHYYALILFVYFKTRDKSHAPFDAQGLKELYHHIIPKEKSKGNTRIIETFRENMKTLEPSENKLIPELVYLSDGFIDVNDYFVSIVTNIQRLINALEDLSS